VEELKVEGTLRRRCRLRQCKYLNNVVEQDHRTVKKRVWLAKGYGSFHSAWRTARHRNSPYDSKRKSEMAGQRRCAWSKLFITALFGILA
jgi:transposase-like protein